MNERIKELWEEATLSTWPRPGKFTAGEYDHHLVKFAELVVKDCIGEIDRVFDRGPDGLGLEPEMELDGYYLAGVMHSRCALYSLIDD